MKIGTRVVLLVRRHGGGYFVCCAAVMVTGQQNVGRIRVRVDDPNFVGTGWIYPEEEGIEWARGWNGRGANALRALVALS